MGKFVQRNDEQWNFRDQAESDHGISESDRTLTEKSHHDVRNRKKVTF